MKITFTSLALLLLFNVMSLAQSIKKNELAIDRRQGRTALDNSIGFGKFIFGSPVALYKDFKSVPNPGEPSKRYFSKIPVSYNNVRIDSVNLDFYKGKLHGINLYVPKSQIHNLISYCTKNFGPHGIDSPEGVYEWVGRKKRIVFYEIENDTFEVLLADHSNFEERNQLSDTTTNYR